ncbi:MULTISPECIES: hypothetical protein [unclassified Bacillus (in: firmicutes)]|uniref:hypothetical protein n=1 Tax=unclassified Bacillus (in: firmicutes) TaxID=185979 RepID=UPI0008ED7F96|nr:MULTISPECIES: hypothetical protein [unclassified Bacillus (in: firmicutes)]SFA86525.1 hypothetical protein SAMN02799634_102134 [Bacillus sp. UNCCL13]SFQ83734.1 hypothetical protein SAMN04488577_2255 [Bacillus sp. cl95]
MFTIQSHLLYFFVSLGMYNYFELEDYVPTISLMFLTVNVILQYYLGYKFRRIYKVLVDDEFSQESNNVPILRAVGYAVDRVFLNFIYFILFIFSTIGSISSLIEGHPVGLVLVLSSIVFFPFIKAQCVKRRSQRNRI